MGFFQLNGKSGYSGSTASNRCQSLSLHVQWSVALGLELCGPARHIQLHHEFSGDEVTTIFFKIN